MSSKKFTLASPSATTASSRASSPPRSANGSSDDEDYDSSLPFPTPLPRASFLQPPPGTFSPTAYLTALGPRHQTLEDLRGELRIRSTLINRELLDLVNDHYEDFLNLGGSLKGGEEKVEEVRVGLMALAREVEGVKKGIQEREQMVGELVGRRERVRREVEVGRGLLKWCGRVDGLEAKLGIAGTGKKGNDEKGADDQAVESDSEDGDEEEESEEEEEDDEVENLRNSIAVPLGKLKRRTHEFVAIESLAEKLGRDHPLLVAQWPRVGKIKETLLLDMGTALKEAKSRASQGSERLMSILDLYRELGAAKEAVSSIKTK